MEKVIIDNDKIIKKVISDYKKAIKNRAGGDELKEQAIWIIENAVAITIKEIKKALKK